ncbi:MAG: pyridoxal phosphate-dependent aminotransferase [Oligoflexus sp.]
MARLDWKAFESSIFSEISQLSQKHNAVNLAQGFPDFDGPKEVKEAAITAIQDGFNQYAPSNGILELRRSLAARQKKLYSVNYQPEDEITIFSGATEALFCSIVGLCSPGDEIICFEPFYESYPAAAMLAGASLKTVPLQAPDWQFDAKSLADAITSRTKMLILNTPHNPTGKVFNRDELKSIAELVIRHNLIVVTDEVYEELVFSPARHFPLITIPGMRDRTVCVSSFSKTFSLTGWKVGYAFAPKHLTKFIRIPHQYTVFCSTTPLQWGMLAALELGDDYFHLFREEYAKRRMALYEVLRKHGFECRLPAGTYFIMADYSALSDEDDYEFVQRLVTEAGVAAIPTSGFYLDAAKAKREMRYVRFGFCKDLKTIATADRCLGSYFG